MWMKNIFLILSFISICEGFFSVDISKVKPHLNLTCYYNSDYNFTNCDYCVYESYSNGSSSIIIFDCIQITNTYKIISNQCNGFTNQRDIGYGICTPPPFDYSDISILCICATNMCNMDFTGCQSSVDYQIKTNTVPSLLPSIISDLSKSISCFDTFYSNEQNSMNISEYCVNYPSPFINLTECNQYVLNNTVLCLYIFADDNYGTYSLTIDSYQMYLVQIFDLMNQLDPNPNVTQYYNQSSSYFYIQWNFWNGTDIWERCFCAQDNCDSSLTNCLNSNRSILMNNSATNLFLNPIYHLFSIGLIIKFIV
jgi:hypothetical protein